MCVRHSRSRYRVSSVSRKSGHLQYLSAIWTRRTLDRHCRVRLPKAQVPIRFINVAEPPATRSERSTAIDWMRWCGSLQDRAGEHAEVCQVLEGLYLEKIPSAYDLCSVHPHG